MDSGKYIIFAGGNVLIFPHEKVHSLEARSRNLPVRSAGFFYVDEGQVVCYGSSMTLGIGAAPDDGIELAKMLGL